MDFMKLDIQLFADGEVQIKVTADAKEFEKGLNDVKKTTKEGFTVFKGTMANLTTDAVRMALNGVKELGSAVVNLGKQSIMNYADYEQLVGGVETLFKESSGVIKKYADGAYKTAGLSANEYMETVTSFSASLIQSLGGDTEKAAEYSNRAITDMSDNANKMGTNIGMIQNAYQGFAKGNMTMLDNLKLGYGGTQEEMKRLISDASKMTDVQKELGVTVDANSMSFGNIVNAISVVQKKMGIMGTTAEEADKTISGSFNSMKASWTNLLTGFASEDADIGKLLGNFVESVKTFGKNLLPRIKILLDNVMSLISEFAPTIIETIGNLINSVMPKLPSLLQKILPFIINGTINLLNGLVKTLPTLLPILTNGIISAFSGIVEILPEIAQPLIEGTILVINEIAKQLPTLIPIFIDAMIKITDVIIDNIDLFINAAFLLIGGLASGLLKALPKILEKAPILIDKLVTKLTAPDMLNRLIQSGISLITQLAIGLIRATPKILEAIGRITVSLAKGLGNLLSTLRPSQIGKNIIQGLWSGISGASGWMAGRIKDFCHNMIDKFKKALKIHSPSQVMRDEIGIYMAQGVGVGFNDELSSIYADMQKAINFENAKLQGNVEMGKVFNMINNSTPVTITLDASVEMDNQKVGRLVAPSVMQSVKTRGGY